MRPVDLEGALPSVVCGRELRDCRGAPEAKKSAKETTVDAIILEVLVHPDEILRSIAEIGGIKCP